LVEAGNAQINLGQAVDVAHLVTSGADVAASTVAPRGEGIK
jgi:hypothetical protein